MGEKRFLRIAHLGLKGFPAVWGGVEFHVTEIAPRLARLGHEVTVFVRPSYQKTVKERGLSAPEGVRVVEIPSVATKHLDAFTHTLLSTLCARGRFDILHYHGIGPGALIPPARALSRVSVKVLTVHALDWKREKWNPAAGRILRFFERVAVKHADVVVAVSREIARYVSGRYGREPEVIPNGVRPARFVPPGRFLASLDLRPGEYFLYVGRLVPEKGAHFLVEAFPGVRGGRKLVLAGPHQEEPYARHLVRNARRDSRILFPGVVEGRDLAELYSNAGALVVPSLLEGAPLSFLEGLSYGLPVAASDTPELREAASLFEEGEVLFFPPGRIDSLTRVLERLCAREASVSLSRRLPPSDSFPSWDETAERVERVYLRALRGNGRKVV